MRNIYLRTYVAFTYMRVRIQPKREAIHNTDYVYVLRTYNTNIQRHAYVRTYVHANVYCNGLNHNTYVHTYVLCVLYIRTYVPTEARSDEVLVFNGACAKVICSSLPCTKRVRTYVRRTYAGTWCPAKARSDVHDRKREALTYVLFPPLHTDTTFFFQY